MPDDVLVMKNGLYAVPAYVEAKGQRTRLMDVLMLGPFLIWAGATRSTLPDLARVLLVVSGAGTIWYNWRNYQSVRRTVPLYPTEPR